MERKNFGEEKRFGAVATKDFEPGEEILTAHGWELNDVQLFCHLINSMDEAMPNSPDERVSDALDAIFPRWLGEAPDDWRPALSKFSGLVDALAAQLVGHWSHDGLWLLLLRLNFNSFEEGFFPRAALLNHSCAPNCATRLLPRADPEAPDCELRVFATRSIARGEELCISYAAPERLLGFPTREERKEYLQRQFGFECACARCRGDGGGPGGELEAVEALWVEARALVGSEQPDAAAVRALLARLEALGARLEAILGQHPFCWAFYGRAAAICHNFAGYEDLAARFDRRSVDTIFC